MKISHKTTFPNIDEIIDLIRRDLEFESDEKTKHSSMHFFKEKIRLYGVNMPTTGKIGKIYFKESGHLSKKEHLELCTDLWKSGYIEESIIACNWSYSIHKTYDPKDFKLFDRWVSTYLNNWASCDTLCNHTIGTFIEMYPEFLQELKTWTLSSNRWKRRASAVSLIVPARKGKFLAEIMEIATLLLQDTDDMVQKGYGWMLKVASQAHQKEVFDFVMTNKSLMPRTALRYAIEKMPREMKAMAMAK